MPGRLYHRWRRLRWWAQGMLLGGFAVGIPLCGFLALNAYSQLQTNSLTYIRRWVDNPSSRSRLTTSRQAPCPGAPFLLPSEGLMGLLWRDPALPYNVANRHSGIDVFGDGAPGTIPVVAAYEGYLSRLDGWVSSVIIRHDDPLQPGRTIWTYYTHMASREGESYIAADFPPGTQDKWVEQGTLLGYQGVYSGSRRPVGLHLHFSIVKSYPNGTFKNETNVDNTLDPSPYLGMPLNIDTRPERPIRCDASE
ncbi:MAG: hypothetical protein GYB66_01025 [Chloroflexi bacterium]|nr:hypothetical protein [Chloroflexota bacterium]